MILPLVVLVGLIASSWFANEVRTMGDEGLTLIAFGIVIVFVGWLLVEVAQFAQTFAGSDRGSDRDG